MRSRQIRKEIEMPEKLALQIKEIYSKYHAREISPEQALDDLELVLNGETE
jgi:hypothetical protein